MTVRELIEELGKYPQDAPVRTDGEVAALEQMTFYGETVVYLYGTEEI